MYSLSYYVFGAPLPGKSAQYMKAQAMTDGITSARIWYNIVYYTIL